MILSDNTIKKHIANGTITVEPTPDDSAIQPSSIDLRLGTHLRKKGGEKFLIGPRYALYPNKFILGDTAERITLPDNLVAVVEGKSSQGRLGISIHCTAGYIDPGFSGTITLELKNQSEEVEYLRPGMLIAQIRFVQMTTPADRPYGSDGLNSHYQNQEGPTLSASK